MRPWCASCRRLRVAGLILVGITTVAFHYESVKNCQFITETPVQFVEALTLVHSLPLHQYPACLLGLTWHCLSSGILLEHTPHVIRGCVGHELEQHSNQIHHHSHYSLVQLRDRQHVGVWILCIVELNLLYYWLEVF